MIIEEKKEYNKNYYKNNKEMINKKYIEYKKEYRENNKEKIKEYKKIFYINNKEKVLTDCKIYREKNKEKLKIQQKEYIEKNKEKRKKYYKLWREKNKEKIKENDKKYRENNKINYKIYRKENKEKINYNRNINYTTRIKKDPLYKLSKNLRCRILIAIKSKKWNKNNKTKDILGCDFETVKLHLENNFVDEMSWDNHGLVGWHIDHIIPLSSAKTEEELYKLCHYTNLQPLWAEDNLKKSDKLNY